MFNENELFLLKAHLGDYLHETHTPARERDKWNCPCGSSDALHFNRGENTWYCYSCNCGGDLLELYAYDTGKDSKSDFVQIVADLASRYGILLDSPGTERQKLSAPPRTDRATKKPQDYSAFVEEAAACLLDSSSELAVMVRNYLKNRAISRDTTERFGLGAAMIRNKACLVIPSADRKTYNARIIDPGEGHKYTRPSGSFIQPLTALHEGQEAQPCWIVEGELDALSIWQAGGNSLAISGAANTKLAIDYAQKHCDTIPVFVLAYDADKAGQTATKATLDALTEANIPCYAWPRLKGDARDMNDILQQDYNCSSHELETMVRQARNWQGLSAAAIAKLQQLDGQQAFDRAFQRIEAGTYTVSYATPFPQLNAALYGGFHPGLVVLGATTGAGKTTYALQLASCFAENGSRVLYISLEMAAVELYTRIVSRILATRGRRLDVTALALRQHYTDLKSDSRVIDARAYVRERIAPRLNIVEGIGDFSALQITELAGFYALQDGTPPVVIVDYLQMLATTNPRLTDKQAIDASIRKLKQLSRDLNALVIAISSYNRDAYEGIPSLKALKESGAIEYTADLVLALDTKQDGSEQSNAETRDITLHCLKHRDGRRFTLDYTYTPAVNRFEEENGAMKALNSGRRY